MAQSMKTEKNVGMCMQHIFSLIVGVVFMYLCGSVGYFLRERWLGPYTGIPIATATIFFNGSTVIFAMIGIVFALVLYHQTEQKRAATNRVARILFLVLQALLILSCFVFDRQISALYGNYRGFPEVFAILKLALSAAAISMALCSAVWAAVGATIKKKSFLLIFLVDLAAFALSLAAMFIGALGLGLGVRGIALSLGIMQPAAVLLPNVGGWNYGGNAQGPVPTYDTGMQAGKRGNYDAAAQKFCPRCGAGFPAAGKYCDQCGAELSVIPQYLGGFLMNQDPNCLFCKIVKGGIPSSKVYEDEACLAFYDIDPQAPVHFLVIPKIHIPSCGAIDSGNSALVAHMFEVISKVTKGLNVTDFRVVSNCGVKVGQSVPHLHFHVLAGRDMTWPPG